MKKIILLGCSLTLVLSSFALTAAQTRQDGTTTAAQPKVVRDPELEKESNHNLEVARHYFKLKKAYRATLARCEEVIAGDPNFSRLDEVLYIAGMSSLRLSENRGKQSANAPADKLREDAREYFSRVVDEYPDSDFRKEAESRLQTLGGAKATNSSQ
jgi:outer membrane protein assembly factor BamD (BamD/ComL family)